MILDLISSIPWCLRAPFASARIWQGFPGLPKTRRMAKKLPRRDRYFAHEHPMTVVSEFTIAVGQVEGFEFSGRFDKPTPDDAGRCR